MQILIVGFQRSGTTLLRRILGIHPQVRSMFHEVFLLHKFDNKNDIIQFVSDKGVNPVLENWGEKAPFYPNVKKIPVIDYCRRWNGYFGETGRILHIVRHPLDVAQSVVVKKGKGNIKRPLDFYKLNMRSYISKIQNIKTSFTFKYEDMIMNPDEMIPQIFEFCGLKKDIDFRESLSLLENSKYQTINPSRAFAYRSSTPVVKINLSGVYHSINKNIGGAEYTI